jgi:hypothetical protein
VLKGVYIIRTLLMKLILSQARAFDHSTKGD